MSLVDLGLPVTMDDDAGLRKSVCKQHDSCRQTLAQVWHAVVLSINPEQQSRADPVRQCDHPAATSTAVARQNAIKQRQPDRVRLYGARLHVFARIAAVGPLMQDRIAVNAAILVSWLGHR
jgi:hypothetical protein